jgi:hypothetical protein
MLSCEFCCSGPVARMPRCMPLPRHSFAVLCLLGFGAAASSGCSEVHIPKQLRPEPSQAQLIIAHWNKWQEHERRVSAAIDEMSKNTWLGDPAVFENYYQSLLTVDVSRCPADYQQAWQEYLTTVREFSELSKANVGVVGIATQALASVATGGISAAVNISSILDATERGKACKGRLKALAIKYGVTF